MVSRFKFKEQNREEIKQVAKQLKNGMTYEDYKTAKILNMPKIIQAVGQTLSAEELIDSVSYSPEEQADINLSKVCRSMK